MQKKINHFKNNPINSVYARKTKTHGVQAAVAVIIHPKGNHDQLSNVSPSLERLKEFWVACGFIWREWSYAIGGNMVEKNFSVNRTPPNLNSTVATLTTASALPPLPEEVFTQFITAVNSFHSALKYTREIFDTSLAFLDIKNSVEGSGLCFSV